MISVLYKIYQLVIGLPLLVILTIVTALEVGIGTTIGNGHFWGYYPGHWWGKLILKLFLIPVKVEGREHLEKGSGILRHFPYLWSSEPQFQVDDETVAA